MSDQPNAVRLQDRLMQLANLEANELAEVMQQAAERIEALEADRDCWIDQCSQRVADWSEAQDRIEADEALMRTALETLESFGCLAFRNIPCRCSKRCDSFNVGTALRKRLESSNGL